MSQIVKRAHLGIGGMYVLPSHFNNVHPFVARSMLTDRSETNYDPEVIGVEADVSSETDDEVIDNDDAADEEAEKTLSAVLQFSGRS